MVHLFVGKPIAEPILKKLSGKFQETLFVKVETHGKSLLAGKLKLRQLPAIVIIVGGAIKEILYDLNEMTSDVLIKKKLVMNKAIKNAPLTRRQKGKEDSSAADDEDDY